ncbi:hypothetical protein BDZ89DRAFT_1070090 [Hymenopellis radicata]|nr:hypothetical protein BDZ89DRAFT_1070090 [Hymenopellis radicata]
MVKVEPAIHFRRQTKRTAEKVKEGSATIRIGRSQTNSRYNESQSGGGEAMNTLCCSRDTRTRLAARITHIVQQSHVFATPACRSDLANLATHAPLTSPAPFAQALTHST